MFRASILFLLLATYPYSLAYTEYQTEKICEIITTKKGTTETCRRVYVPEKREKSQKSDKSDKK
jgi:hypothetical protein